MVDVIIWSGTPDRNPKLTPRYIGPYKIAKALRDQSYSCQIIDFINFMTEKQLYFITKKFLSNKTLVLAISTTFLNQILYTWPDGLKKSWPYHVYCALKQIKLEHPYIKIILGGHKAHAIDGLEIVDASVINYGEDIIIDLLDFYKWNKPEPHFEVNKIINPPYTERKMYDKPVKVRHNIQYDTHLFTDNDCIIDGETLPIEISRGCRFKCKFCYHLLLGRGKLDYLRDFELIKNQMLHNKSNWSVSNYFVICDTFNDTAEKMQRWYNMVKSLPFNINYTGYVRADLLYAFPEQAHILKETGIYSVFHGIETFGTESSKIIGKGWSGKYAKDWLPKLYHDVWNGEVLQHLSFIVGLPGDTRESLLDTARWFVNNKMWSTEFIPLDLSYNKTQSLRRSSEFEKTYEMYGYSFPNKNNQQEWHLPYWNKTEAANFAEIELKNTVKASNVWFNSWSVGALKTFGIPEQWFTLAWQQTNSLQHTIETINAKSDIFMEKYTQKLCDL
jgi:radical SAM superfamily enzyme YgiQ (UPF0313 family)